ncbi:MAG: DUF2141 domain-containing protein [Cryomorphaceae bacterium]|jgi:uncharacterized protein (DUF2141 family)|nr:DUF2141 domain-containing protein [Cryomorphaceae bacterium]MBT3689505.1 DUF2141 domain-containing protein [Cryomorphaceae bacterium]MBT7019109.1 DUF2141 domain-containing protein [Cryomorphaceae bacterium]
MFSGYSQPKKTNYTLNITVTKFANTDGVLRVCITDQKDDFLDGCLFSKIISIEGETVSLSFESLKEGVYAVSVYHDENNNGVLETSGLFGFPSEPFGFSENPSMAFGPPSFKKSAFKVNADKNIIIKLK